MGYSRKNPNRKGGVCVCVCVWVCGCVCEKPSKLAENEF